MRSISSASASSANGMPVTLLALSVSAIRSLRLIRFSFHLREPASSCFKPTPKRSWRYVYKPTASHGISLVFSPNCLRSSGAAMKNFSGVVPYRSAKVRANRPSLASWAK